jgi:chromosomal replication initiation ATPase DnaA
MSGVDQLIAEVAARRGLTVLDLKSERRGGGVAAVRHEVMWRLRSATALSLPAIGRALGGFSHTTVLRGVRRHQARLEGR